MPYCTVCGYDLAAHGIGDRCPECGASITRVLAAPPPNPTAALIGLGLVPILLVLLLAFSEDVRFLYIWIAVESLVLGLMVLVFFQYRRARCTRYWWSFLIAAAASAAPLCTFVLFLWVFVIGGSSNVAQLAGDRMDLLFLWNDAWPYLLLTNPVSALLAVISAALPPYRVRHCGAWALPCAAFLAAAVAVHIIGVYFPDA